MRARGCLLILTWVLVVLAAPSVAGAQSSEKTWRVGLLSTSASTPTAPSRGFTVLVRALNELGYVEGRNVTIVPRYAEGKAERLPALAAELVNAKVDIIVTAGYVSAVAVQKVTATIPIVAATTDDPVAVGLAQSLARPGGNVTGVVVFGTELASKRLEVLKELLPKVTRVGVLTSQGAERQAEAMQATAARLGVHLVRLEVSTADEIDRAFERAQKDGLGALVVIPSSFVAGLRPRIISLAARYRLPAMYPGRAYAEAGGLVAYGPDIDREAFSRAAVLVDRILKGARPADLPFEQVTKIELVVNAKTARALGLTFPPSILARGEVVE